MHAKREDFAGSLSGGQRKLLEMARALMTNPEMVMLDEPMAGVNPALTQSLLQHIKDLREEGMTVLFVEHDMDMVRDISDWVIVMAQGKVIAEGPPDEVMRNEAVIVAYLGGHHDKALTTSGVSFTEEADAVSDQLPGDLPQYVSPHQREEALDLDAVQRDEPRTLSAARSATATRTSTAPRTPSSSRTTSSPATCPASTSSTAPTCTPSPGELVGIIGPNGAGKSTLLKAMFGLVRVRDRDASRWPTRTSPTSAPTSSSTSASASCRRPTTCSPR